MLSAALCGYGFAKFQFKGKILMFGVVILSIVIPPQTVMLSLFSKFRYFDIFGLLRIITGDTIVLTGSFLPAAILAVTGFGFRGGLFIFLMRQFYSGLPKELLEAAYVDGASVYRTYFSIIFPLGKTLMVTVFLLSFSWMWTDTFYANILYSDINIVSRIIAQSQSTIGSAGVVAGTLVSGMYVYYPNQDINNVKPYPFTFYVVGTGTDYMLQSVVNCTVINGYRGVGACVSETNAHEMMTIDTVKGTFLKVGFEAYNQADVGTWKNVTISSYFWANAGAGLKSASQSKIDAYCKANTTGLKLGDLEWTEFSNLSISGCNTGINIVKGKRIEFAGSLFDFKITDCLHGLIVDSIDERWGMVASQGEISATVAIKNNTNGVVKMAGCQINGQITGNHIANDSSMDKITVSYRRKPLKPAPYLYVVSADITGLTDTSAAIQAQLNKAKKTGGIVYLPAGKYLLQKSLTVPAGVELRGCSSAAQREQNYASEGTLILADYGQTVSPDTAQALVTLQGVNSGVRGVRFFYINNNFRLGVKKYSYTIRGRASGVYAVNVSIAAGYNGIDFRNCDNHHIDKLIGCCYQNMIAAGGKNGMIEGCLQNGTILYRNGLDLIGWSKSEQMIQNELFNPITRPNTEYIRLENATGETILNTFAYGVRNLIVSQNSTGVKIVNVGADNLYNTTPLLEVLNGEVFGVNIMRYNGKSYQNTNGKIKLYNRLTINNQSEQTVIE